RNRPNGRPLSGWSLGVLTSRDERRRYDCFLSAERERRDSRFSPLAERLVCGPRQCKPDLLCLAAEHGGHPSVGPRWPLVLVQKQLGGFVTALPVNHHRKRKDVP
ncbi:MAG: hypothetical protein KAS81_08455, partial [Anaerolineales bacterium]|nr:hypothetical protein [Anaerolineales bacterium]